MATGLVLTVAQTLFAALDSKALKEICSMFGYKSDLEELKGTVSTIQAVLLDAEAKQVELSHEAKDWVDKLKDALYDVDDLLDEFNTITQQRKHKASGNNKISQKVRRFFSRSNPLLLALSTSLDIKKIKNKLDAIASDHSKFGLSTVDCQSIWKRREETCSHVYEEKIIGRNGDKEKLVGMLLNSEVDQEDVSYVSIVGIGGLGKTTLAQLLYNDDRIKSEFQLRLWVCVSQEFGVKEILGKMLKSLVANEMCHDLVLDQLQSKVRQNIETQKYLLVLDDVWNESREAWVKLKDFLARGTKGSKIVVTTRSKNVARAIGNYPIYELQGLSEEDTWKLFKFMAFDREEQHVDPNLVEIGKDIVKKCTNVPLSVRVIGSLLYGQGRDKWLLFQKNDLAKIQGAIDSTMAILKFSYSHLTPSLKSCFSYCALFPKNYVIEKDMLIDLWMANGCIVPQCESQIIEDVGEEYFSTLLQRCFFQDITEEDSGGIISCRVHDLIHDLALEVAGHESVMLWSMTSHSDRRIRHLSVLKQCHLSNSPHIFPTNMKTMRTFLQIPRKFCTSDTTRISSNWIRLRCLELRDASLETLPNGIGRLIHLRCLDLSYNWKLKIIPESITNLHNLQVLKLRNCMRLRELPKHFSRLVNLRHLDIDGCNFLTRMPIGLKNLTCLHQLTTFVLSGDSKEVQMSQLEELKALANLRGRLTIRVMKLCSNEISEVGRGGYLLSKPHLKHLEVKFEGNDQGDEDVQEVLLEGFQPNCNLISMGMFRYKGVKLASWLLVENTVRSLLSHLVEMTLEDLPRVQLLPVLSQLLHLKELYVRHIPNLEYMESNNGCAPLTDLIFFPSLEVLELVQLPKIKGWWRDGAMMDVEVIGSVSDGIGCSKMGEQYGCGISPLLLFPRLRKLVITSCPNMRSFPPCPHMKVLRLFDLNEVPLFTKKSNHIDGLCTREGSSLDIGVASVAKDSCCVIPLIFALDKLETDNARFMLGLPKESIRGLAHLEIGTSEESLSETEEVFRSCASSLQFLKIFYSNNLKTLCGGGIEHLTCVQNLIIHSARQLELEQEDENGMPWKCLHNLTSLSLINLPKLENLPKGLQHLTSLQSLHIDCCINLTGLPEWLSCLTSLRSVHINDCDNFTSSQAMHDSASPIKVRVTTFLDILYAPCLLNILSSDRSILLTCEFCFDRDEFSVLACLSCSLFIFSFSSVNPFC